MLCDDQGLISREMFAIDGRKMPSNASKENGHTLSLPLYVAVTLLTSVAVAAFILHIAG